LQRVLNLYYTPEEPHQAGDALTAQGSSGTKWESHGHLLPAPHLWDPPDLPLSLLSVSAAE